MPVNMPEIRALDDSVLDPYRELRSRRWAEQHGMFVVEGQLLVERLFASDYAVQSVLIDRQQYDKFDHSIPPAIQRYVIESEEMRQLVGYRFHRGILACGVRKPLLSVAEQMQTPLPTETLVGLLDVQDPANVGGILRSCAALGVRQVLIGPGTADPLSRRALRVSMGSALNLQLYETVDFLKDLGRIRQVQRLEIIASSLEANSDALERCQRSGPVLILFGNERHGLPQSAVDAADRCVRIDMEQGIDSLNVAIAAGIVLHYFCRLA
jgi:tRNA G18 (ribose-2'-O)-methylase SpoU